MSLEEQVVDKILKEANIKIAKIFAVGDKVVLVDQVQNLNKGQIFKVIDMPESGKITIADFNNSDDNDDVGETRGTFNTDRFTAFNSEY